MKRGARIYRLQPAGLLDRTSPQVMMHAGKLVRKVQPHGCPRNGTMRMAYVETVDRREFVGLVCLSALVTP